MNLLTTFRPKLNFGNFLFFIFIVKYCIICNTNLLENASVIIHETPLNNNEIVKKKITMCANLSKRLNEEFTFF